LVRVLNSVTFAKVAQVMTDATQGYAFRIPALAPGTYVIVAGTDRNQDSMICAAADACGTFPEPVTITAGQDTTGLDFVVGELLMPQSASLAAARLHAGRFIQRQ
jgi:hypothetical protein